MASSMFTEFTVREGYVFYDRLKKGKGHWKNLYARRKVEISQIEDLKVRDWQEIADQLYSLGMAERAKEMALLQKYLPGAQLPSIEDIDFQTLITEINRLLLGKQQFEDMLRVLNGAITHQTTKDNKLSKERSPMIASYFMSYFHSALAAHINDFQKYVKNNCINVSSSQYNQEFHKMIDISIDDAIERMSKAEEKYANKDQVWKKLIEFYNSSPFFQRDLKQVVFTQVDFEGLKNLAIQQTQASKSGYGYISRKDIQTSFDMSEKEERTLGGLIHENIANAMSGAHLTVDLNLGNVAVKNLSSNMLRTDNVILFAGQGVINPQFTLDTLDNTLLGANSLEDSRNRLQDFYNRNLANLTDSFMVFVSAKSYALTDSFQKYGFSDGSPAPLSHIPKFLDQVGVDYQKADLFIKKMYSTIPGALGSGQNGDYTEALRQTMVEAMAYLLFDDWRTIGEQNMGPASIHLFNLDGIYVPLSGLLIALGSAAKQPAGYFRVSFNKPKGILYPDSISAKTVDEIDPYWEEQKNAMRDYQFSVHFLTNFKSIVMSYFR